MNFVFIERLTAMSTFFVLQRFACYSQLTEVKEVVNNELICVYFWTIKCDHR